MPIQYVLYENSLPNSPNTFRAAVLPTRTAALEDVVDYMVLHGSKATKTEILDTLGDYFQAIEEMVLDGQNVNTPNAHYRASIKGKFAGLSDDYDPSRHRIIASVSPSRRFNKAIASQAHVVKERSIKPRPFPDDFFDLATSAHNSTVTPGGMGQVVGEHLRFDPADREQGIFFQAADGKVTRVETVGRNMPSDLVFLIPALAPGQYTLEVCAIINDGTELRRGELGAVLVVG